MHFFLAPSSREKLQIPFGMATWEEEDGHSLEHPRLAPGLLGVLDPRWSNLLRENAIMPLVHVQLPLIVTQHQGLRRIGTPSTDTATAGKPRR